MAKFFPLKSFIRIGLLLFVVVIMVKSDDANQRPLSAWEIENMLQPLLASPDVKTLQAQALRRQLAKLLRQGLEQQVDNGLDEKRSVSSLARWDNLPNKRNVEALARSGYLKLPQDEAFDDDDSEFKRSIANLAKTGQLPFMINDDNKRGIESLARNGELHHSRQDLEELLDELHDKRNIGSLARGFGYPSYGKRFLGSLARSGDLYRFENDGKRNLASVMRGGKRSIASLARYNNLPSGIFEDYKRNIASLARDGTKIAGKRNVAALLRQDSYSNEQHQRESDDPSQTEKPELEGELAEAEKRNLGSIKAQFKQKFKRSLPLEQTLQNNLQRKKRQIDYYEPITEEYPSPVYQNQNFADYEELLEALGNAYPTTEKRFLGSVAKSGWPSSLKFRSPDKRHIGALARLGWLPSFRSTRRFNRSGRSANYVECGVCRETSTDGQTEDNPFTKDSSSVEDKRFLLIPAVDNILLRKYPRPRVQ